MRESNEIEEDAIEEMREKMFHSQLEAGATSPAKLELFSQMKHFKIRYCGYSEKPICKRINKLARVDGILDLESLLDSRGLLKKLQINGSVLETGIKISVSIKTLDFPIFNKKKLIPVKLRRGSGDLAPPFSALLCTKLYTLAESDHRLVDWWLLMNKMIGYSKIIIYNNTIENGPNLNRLWQKYADFVEIRQFHCFPNFFGDRTPEFLTRANELVRKENGKKKARNTFEVH